MDLRTYLSRTDAELPERLGDDESAEQIIRLHTLHGGATFSLYFGNQAGQRLYAISLFPDRSFVLSGKHLSPDVIERFLKANADLLSDPQCCVGTWYSEETDQTYIDVAVVAPNKRVATSLAKRYNQEGAFDLFRMEYIPTGGTGEPPENMPPASERLAELRLGRAR